jgi:uncharacterized protein
MTHCVSSPNNLARELPLRGESGPLNNKADLARIEQVLRTDSTITALVNNAGIGATAPLLDSDLDTMDRMIGLNVTALVRLTYAIVPPFVKRGSGTIINMASIVGIAPEVLNGVYGGTKAFVLAFNISLHQELAESKIRIQVILPGATATDFWATAGTPVEQLPSQVVPNIPFTSLPGSRQGV